jgi:hypothetical protein
MRAEGKQGTEETQGNGIPFPLFPEFLVYAAGAIGAGCAPGDAIGRVNCR